MKSILSLAILLSTFPLLGQTEGHNNLNKKGVALSGYDVVSYFNQKNPIMGSKEYSLKKGDAIYYFANAENKEAYLNNPEKYPVVYGGWCAYAVGLTGEKVEVDPLTYKIIDGQLHLFYNKFFNDTLDKWNKNEAEFKKNAEKNWKKITAN